jgi:hypothetical protein
MHSALERYEDVDYTFSGSREGKLLKVLSPREVIHRASGKMSARAAV